MLVAVVGISVVVMSFVSVRMLMTVTMCMLGMAVFVLVPERFARKIFFAVGVHIDFGRRNSCPHHSRNLKPRSDIERGDRFFKKFRRNSSIHQRAKKHVAADARKAV